MSFKNSMLTIGLVGLLMIGAGAVMMTGGAAAEEGSYLQENSTATETPSCEGNPTMARNSIVSPDAEMTPETVGVVEANFRVDETLPEDCTVIVDLQFSFAQSGFQFQGGAEWDQSATDIVATEFELAAGEIRSLDAELIPNGAEIGDEVTVTADYEIWYEGDKENSRQVSGVRETLEVVQEEPTSTPTPEDTDTSSSTSDDSEATSTTAPDDGDDEDETGILEAIGENIVVVILGSGVVLIGLVLAWKGPTIIGIRS